MSLLKWEFLFSPFLFGMFFPWTSAIISLFLVILLFLIQKRQGICHSRSPVLLMALSLEFFLLLGMIWGCDRGMALVGAVQFLPIPLFVFALEQFRVEQRTELLRGMPYIACLMVLLSLLLSCLISKEGWFLVSGRQAGFFQYPNTYALYLLCALAILLFDKKPVFGVVPWSAVLVIGILLSGSRTVFVLLFCLFLFYIFTERNKTKRLKIMVFLGILTLGLALTIFLTGDRSSIGRFLTISLSSSEILGRVLYARDAIPIIVIHPFGLGYMGYSWLQGSFQTGVYSVQHVHNDLLQLLLDVGWIPTGLLLWILIRFFLHSAGDFRRSMPAALICLHSLMDFDTQFVAVAMLLFLAIDVEPKADIRVDKYRLSGLVLLCCAGISLWIGLASWKCYLRDNKAAVRIYPGYTSVLAELLPKAPADEMEILADRVLKLNPNASVACDAKALAAYRRGELDQALQYKERAIFLSKYNLSEYIDCFTILRQAYEEALSAGEKEKAQTYLSLLEQIPDRLKAVRDGTSALGWKIRDLPSFDFPQEYLIWLNEQRYT